MTRSHLLGPATLLATALLLALPAHAQRFPAPRRACEVTESRDRADTRRAEAACAAVRARYAALFGREAPHGRVRLSDSAGFVNEAFDRGWWQIRWPRSAAPGRARVPVDWTVLPHEMGHLAFAAGDSVARRPWGGYRYGTQHPDWLDEAVAIWFESPGDRVDRLGQARALMKGGAVMPLERLLDAAHPNGQRMDQATIVTREERLTALRCIGACDSASLRASKGPHVFDDRVIRYRQYTGGRESVDTTYYPAGTMPRADATHDFYVLSWATLLFVRELGGQRAFDALLARLHANLPRRTVLRGLPGLPADSAALERRWREWVAAVPDAAATRERDGVPAATWLALGARMPEAAGGAR